MRSAAPGGGIITSSHAVSWDHVGLTADLVRSHAICWVRYARSHVVRWGCDRASGITLPWYTTVRARNLPASMSSKCLSHRARARPGSDLHYFLDGVQTTSTDDTGDLVVRPNDLIIGKCGEGHDGEYFMGMIDDVRLWTRVLSSSEVQSLYSH